MAYDADETACDHCGRPTPRLMPPADLELCDDCAEIEAKARENYDGPQDTEAWSGGFAENH